jgi:hypothetical protein
VSEAAARTEAERQRHSDNSEEAEWIYLRNKDGVWVARRTPRDLRAQTSTKAALLEWITNPFDWLGPW